MKEIVKDYKLYQNAQPNSIYIHEVGLYTLMIRSKKPNAEKFLLWIAEDIVIFNKDNNNNIIRFK